MVREEEVTSIALIGNAQSLFDRSYGAEIDGHDVIARMNRAAILFTRHFDFRTHGSRTDMWFMWRNKEYETVNILKPPFSMQMTYWEELDDESVHLYSAARYAQLQHELGAVPSTGVMVLDFLESLDYEKISVYGFDWKATPTFTDPKRETDKMLNGTGALHDFYAEKRYCQARFISNPRFNFRF